MLKRLIVGLVLGTVIGAVAAALLVKGLGMPFFTTAVVAYLAAAVTGILTGLIAGKPIWSADGKIEAGLKAFFGGALALGGMFALRQWVHFQVDLHQFNAGVGDLGELPATSLPIIAAVLAGFFELDNTPPPEGDEKKLAGGSAKSAAADKKVRVVEAADEDEEDDLEPAQSKKKKGR
ncbi:hypothetical protein AKJ09_03885 [Labilithrix luteola]|uniref:Uncharacterized protein n=1 Tax=Labilithrix luteola TaxID=1391654 RepID=A0A0K1PV38_9BACT|nr:hypothetical protein [Labilithrix luteola]AKU97221.1 hypothetical protein AKJ09_03885 [Labilithrix luteola]